MKKFLSMVMAAAMVVSLVPATAFAASDDVRATAKVVDSKNYTQDEIENTYHKAISGPELQLTFTTADYTSASDTTNVSATYTLTYDNAEVPATAPDVYITTDDGVFKLNGNAYNQAYDFRDASSILQGYPNAPVATDNTQNEVNGVVTKVDDDELEITIGGRMGRGWTLGVDLDSTMDKTSKGKTATISVDSDDVKVTNGDDLVYASVEAKGIKASVKDTVDVATEEIATLEEIKVEPSVGSDFAAVVDVTNPKAELTLRLPSGYEFTKATAVKINNIPVATADVEDDEITIMVSDLNTLGLVTGVDTWKIKGLEVEATSAKAGATGTVKIGLTGSDTVAVEVMKVVDYSVVMSVDEDEDVPVIYSGVNVDNDGITDDSDHMSLEVTLKETYAGAWNNSKDFTLSLPEGVYITNADVNWVGDSSLEASVTPDGILTDKETKWFGDAYCEGEYLNLEFERRTWKETTPGSGNQIEINFELELVADPNFEGDVVLTLTGDAVDEQKVTIAKFVKPFTVEAQQNDLQIDYRNTEIPTSVVIKEAEAGLWDKGARFDLVLDKIGFDEKGELKVDEKSGLEVKDDKVKLDTKKYDNDSLYFTVDSKSDDEPAVVTISGMELYMQRSLPAGAYDLDVVLTNSAASGDYLQQPLFAKHLDDKSATDKRVEEVEDVNDDFYSTTAKAGFVNVVTAGREDTDSFTTKVVVPVGESYLISGENKVEIPVPAYINAAGYTMLPLRAVAVALGINENNVLWDQASRTATVMYGSKIINMTLGQKVVYVNGAMIPATAAVEITNDRMFLGLRDLGTALGVTDIAWDGATKTATLNGNK